jgi:general secretion pathway protein C
VDGVARTVRVGAVVDGELRLLRVDTRSASLGRFGQAPSQILEISPPAAPARGALPPAAPSPVVLGGNPQDSFAAARQRGGSGMPQPVPQPMPSAPPSVYGMPLAASGPGSQPQER